MSKYEKPYPLTRPFLDTAVGDDGRLILHVRQATNKGYAVCVSGGVFDPSYPSSVYRRSRTRQPLQFSLSPIEDSIDYIKENDNAKNGNRRIKHQKMGRGIRLYKEVRQCVPIMLEMVRANPANPENPAACGG